MTYRIQTDQCAAEVNRAACGTSTTSKARTTGYGRSSTFPAWAAEWWIVWPSSKLTVVLYNGGEAPIDKERFVNARAEDFWTLRERFEQGEIDIDPDDDKLAAQLGSIKWGIDSRGRIKIESKDDLRTRGLPSPDRAGCDGDRLRWQGECSADECEESRRRSITGDLITKAW